MEGSGGLEPNIIRDYYSESGCDVDCRISEAYYTSLCPFKLNTNPYHLLQDISDANFFVSLLCL